MRAKIFSFIKNSEKTMVASVGIARFLSSQLGLPIVDDDSVADERLDALIIVNGAYAFCRHLESLAEAILDAERLVWIGNDYTIGIPQEESGAESPFRKAFRDRKKAGKSSADHWTTVKQLSTATPLSHYVNWNCLTLENASDEVIRGRRSASDATLLYYGSYRAGRVETFKRYFTSPYVLTVISSPSRKFVETFRNSEMVRHEGKIEGDLYQYLGRHGLGLCLEDKKSHSEDHSPPNRFYEMLSSGLPMVIQREMGTSLRRHGYDPSRFSVGGPRDVKGFMENREEVGSEQRRMWLPKARGERDEVVHRVQAAWAKLGDTP